MAKRKASSILPGSRESRQPVLLPVIQQPPKTPKYRRGGHLVDNLLKSNKPKSNQVSIFETMQLTTQERVIRSGVSAEFINRKGEGIRFSKGERKLLSCLSALLHDKSQTDNTAEDNYYTGNREAGLITFKTGQGNVSLKSPKVALTLYEIAKEFYGGGKIGGENVRQVFELLSDIADDPEKWALIRYTRTEDMGGGKQREYFMESYDPLVKVLTVGYKDTQNGKQIDEKKEVIIDLHPIFIDQIKYKYIDQPRDILKRITDANGSHNVSEITQGLIDELSRAYSNRNNTTSRDMEDNPIYIIGQNTLFWKIAPGCMDSVKDRIMPNRKPELFKYFNKSIEIAKAVGLLINYEEKPAKDGGVNYVFTLVQDWA